MTIERNRRAAFLLTPLFAFAIAACGGSEAAQPTATPQATTPTPSTAEPTPDAAPTVASEPEMETGAPIELRVTFMAEWDAAGTRLGALREPRGIALDTNGNAYVLDHGPEPGGQGFVAGGTSYAYLLTPQGDLLDVFGIGGDSMGIALDAAGNLLVPDFFGMPQLVWVISPAGEGLEREILGRFGEGQLEGPTGIAVDGQGNIYVVERWQSQIKVFSPDGELLQTRGSEGTGEGQFNWPEAVAFDADGSAYVADSNNHRIQVLAPDGSFLRSWGSQGAREGEFARPSGVAVDPAGRVFVTDTDNHRMQVFSDDGSFLGEWGTPGQGQGEFARPWHIAVDDAGHVFVTEMDNLRVQVFHVEFLPGP